MDGSEVIKYYNSYVTFMSIGICNYGSMGHLTTWRTTADLWRNENDVTKLELRASLNYITSVSWRHISVDWQSLALGKTTDQHQEYWVTIRNVTMVVRIRNVQSHELSSYCTEWQINWGSVVKDQRALIKQRFSFSFFYLCQNVHMFWQIYIY